MFLSSVINCSILSRQRFDFVSFQTGETHFVHHLKFTHWPDHGVPQSSEQLVRFIRYMRAVHHEGPITVHCSAGIGRTGVLICTDIILHLIENDLPVSGPEFNSFIHKQDLFYT